MSICFLAQFPPPIHGLSKAVDTLFHSELNKKYKFCKIDITRNRRILQTLIAIIRNKADIFYFTISQTRGGNLRDLIFLELIKLKKRKCIIHLHGGYYKSLMQNDCGTIQRWINGKLMNHVDKAIVLGDSLRNMFEGFVPQDRIRVVPNCIDDEFLPSKISDKLTSIHERSSIHVVYLSNFIKEKGYREVLEIARLMQNRNRGKDIVFHFAGKFFNKEEQTFFDSFIENNNLSNIKYHGIVMAEEKQQLLKIGNVMVLLTRYPNEGQPISLLEGMGNGMAIITTNHSGIPDIVTDKNGYVCDKHHIGVEEIADYLEKCRADRDYLSHVCNNNFQWVKDNFTQERYIENMDKVFDEVYNERLN